MFLAAATIGVANLWVFSCLQPFASPLLARLQRVIAAFIASGALLVRRPDALLGVLVLSLVGVTITAAALALLANELQADVSPVAIAVVTFGAMLASTIPISIAGWGVREGALVLLFGAYGVPPQTAFAVSILFGACLVIASAPGALGLLHGSAKPAAKASGAE
jgi:uncharacterized protein (TIRG00374 family)